MRHLRKLLTFAPPFLLLACLGAALFATGGTATTSDQPSIAFHVGDETEAPPALTLSQDPGDEQEQPAGLLVNACPISLPNTYAMGLGGTEASRPACMSCARGDDPETPSESLYLGDETEAPPVS